MLFVLYDNTLKKQQQQHVIHRVFTHIFLHVLRFNSFVRRVRWVERPKGEAARKQRILDEKKATVQ